MNGRRTAWDSDPVLPVPETPGPSLITQQGLDIVMAVSQSFEVRREPVGKRSMPCRRMKVRAAGHWASQAAQSSIHMPVIPTERLRPSQQSVVHEVLGERRPTA